MSQNFLKELQHPCKDCHHAAYNHMARKSTRTYCCHHGEDGTCKCRKYVPAEVDA